jgi:phospholipase/lecithinase/hemolysin
MKLLVSLGALFFSSFISAAPLHNIVVFGDSLSDNGNLYEFMKHQLPQSPPYYQGRFSNGPVWVEHLSASYFPNSPDAHLLDFAVGGSGVSEDDEDDVLFTLRKQVNTYFLTHDKANADDLYVLWIGANNYLALPEEADKAVAEVNVGITHSIQRLIDKGAQHILLINLPDLGRTPAAIEFDAADVMAYLSTQHNEELYRSFNELKEKNSNIEWLYFDLGTMFKDVVNHPENYGFTNVTNTCSNSIVDDESKKSLLKMVARVTPKISDDACEGYLFFDLVHPTGLAHRLIAEKVRDMLDEAGVVFSE